MNREGAETYLRVLAEASCAARSAAARGQPWPLAGRARPR